MTNGTVEHKDVIAVVPSVNIKETPDSYLLTLDVPGAVKERISANIAENVLTVTADIQNQDADGEGAGKHQYRREFSLANDIDVNSVDAKYELGVLSVTLKKKAQYLPKQISIA